MEETEWVTCPACEGEGYEDIEQGDDMWTGWIRVDCPECNGAGGWSVPFEDDDPYEPWKA